MVIRVIGLHQSFVFAALFCVFTTAYILTPYWTISSLVWLRYLILVISAGLGLLWAYISSSEVIVSIRTQKYEWLLFVLLFIVLGVINYRALFSVIPWRGDEDYHITTAFGLWRLMKVKVILVGVLFLLFLYEGWRKSKQLLFSAIFLVVLIALIVSQGYIINYGRIARYPFIINWVNLIPLYATVPFVGIFNEASFRILPFLSALILTWLCLYKLSNQNKIIGFLFGVSIGTLPIIFYYTSVLYLEMPALLLMTIVCFGIKDILKGDLRQITKQPAWYALILIGFIKETSLPFLMAFVLSRFIIRFWDLSKTKIKLADVIDETKIIFCTLFPLFLYIFYRNQFGVWRKLSPDFMNLFNTELYVVLARSYLEQFGSFVFLFISGCIVLFIKKKYGILLFFAFSLVADTVFHMIDNAGYIGYSRFNLFLIPAIIVGTYYFLDFLSKKNMKLTGLILSSVIIGHILLSPVNMDGTKQPLWGNYLTDTSEHYYPYQEALLWLKENHTSDKIRFTGMNYPYLFEFYFGKFDWFPLYDVKLVDYGADETIALKQSLSEAAENGIQVVLYHVLEDNSLKIPDTHGFIQEKIFRNEAHMLILYSIEEQ